ncbi:MAG: hypothetical protein Q7U32_05835 [Rhodocyclaceae bacterium]|nr:hypothetical protein [Rhodocyclaceae bacterium]
MKLSDLPADLLAERPHLFSSVTVPIGAADLAKMRALIAAVEHVIALPTWQEFTMRAAGGGTAPAKVGAGGTAQNSATTGVFMGYDFHLTEAGPQLIEINSNAGGGLLAALQAERDDVLDAYVAMFRTECPRELKVLAIVDEAPREQYLYPEFFGFQRLFAQHGIRVLICDPAELLLCHGNLWIEETKLDLVYNRLTDFSLTLPAHAVLREAWRQGVAITPNPAIHARYADKRNLIALTDAALLAEWGVAETTRQTLLAGIPRTEQVTNERAEDFWQQRRQLFFKPAAGFGSKGSYRGDKLTRRVFEEILAANYVAQNFAPPSTVPVEVSGELTELKADIRNYVYRGEVQLVAARLYQGQTTNFRTPGGGFAKVIEA